MEVLILITSDQMRAGRALLRWSVRELSTRAGVGPATVQRLETGVRQIGSTKVDTIAKIQSALEAGGVVFLEDGSVRLK